MTKHRLLQMLEENRGIPVSGTKAAEKIGVSRNAVWKAVRQLKEEGYEITSAGSKGYILPLNSDALSVSGIAMHLKAPCKNRNIIILDETPSTNTYLKDHKDLPDGTLVLAKMQTKGRGRLGKSFYSEDPGGIYMSLLNTDPAAFDTSLSTLAAALAVSKVLDEVLDISTSIKWVNDIYYEGKKLSGILTEGTLEMESGQLSRLIIGIGINVNTEKFPEEIEGIAGSLSQITGKKYVRNEIIGKVVTALEAYLLMTKTDSSRIISEFREKMLYMEEEVTVSKGKETFSATIKGLDDKGHLVLEKDGRTSILSSGEISIRKKKT